MKKILILCLSLFVLVSCDVTEALVFDVESGQALVGYNTANQSFPVSDAGNSVAEVIVGVTNRTGAPRTVTISVDPESTADAAAYTIDNATLVIPAGDFVARVKVTGNFNSLPATGSASLILNLDGLDGGKLDATRVKHTITMFRFCPFEGGSNFLGNYTLSTTGLGIFSIQTFAPGTVTLTQGATIADRRISVRPYPAFGVFGTITFEFSLICGNVIIPGQVRTGVGCDGSTDLGAPTTNSTFDLADDSVIDINFTDDINQNCGSGSGSGSPVSASIRLTKQ